LGNPYQHLEGTIDMHVHASPDLFPRPLDETEVVRKAKEIGMRGILFKSHFTTNADRISVLRKEIDGIEVFGSVILNHAVGGINPEAVFAALNFGAKRIEMPTVDAVTHVNMFGRTYPWSKIKLPEREGISIFDAEGRPNPGLKDIFSLVASFDAVLATGHLTKPEREYLVAEARKAGVKKVLVTHADLDIVSVSIEDQKKLADMGAIIEHALTPCMHLRQRLDPRKIVEAIQAVGADRCILSSDMGQPVNPLPAEGYRMFIETMMHLGINKDDIDTMTKKNPAKLLNLD
jgi:Tat protein secretion system quality control protein TatD with DNase activity